MNPLKLLTALLLLVLSVPALDAQVSNAECAKFHTGEFVDGSLPYITIKRDSVYQVETDTRTGKTSTFSIRWTDSCTYELTFVKSDDKAIRKSSKKIGVLRVTITYTDEEGYRYIATSDKLEVPIRGSVKWNK